jgi:YYY domain-containing protein
MDEIIVETRNQEGKRKFNFLWWPILLFIILAIGAYFRTTGLDWAADYHMHPDERFLTMVESAISPNTSIEDYFNTEVSSLNPHNRGYGFFVYGTLPLFIVRFTGELFNQTGYDDILVIGRFMSAIFDVLTIALVFLIADKIFKKNAISLLASAFYAASVLPIQLSHYLTVDSIANFFTILTFYFAVLIMKSPIPWQVEEIEVQKTKLYSNWRGFLLYILFGISFGMAMASKVSAFFVVIVLPIAIVVQLMDSKRSIFKREYILLIRNLVLAGIISLIVFRIFQPYAFNGPSFLNFSINESWFENMKDLASQTSGNNDSPPALQWARRPITFSFENIVRWGLGLPLGIVAWVGFLWMAWQIFGKKKVTPYLMLWIWTGFFFTYQSFMFSRTMRYQIHIYPLLAIMAACFIYWLWSGSKTAKEEWKKKTFKILFWLTSTITIIGTFGWAYAFVQIYNEPMTRVAASEWIYENVPSALNLKLQTETGELTEHVSYGYGQQISSGKYFKMSFTPVSNNPIYTIEIDHVLAIPATESSHDLIVEVQDSESGETVFSSAIYLPFSSMDDPRGIEYQIPISGMPVLSPDKQYHLILGTNDPTASLQLMGTIAIGYALESGTDYQYLPEIMNSLAPGDSYSKTFSLDQSALLRGIYIPNALDYENNSSLKNLSFQIFDQMHDNDLVAEGTFEGIFSNSRNLRGDEITLEFDHEISLIKNNPYILTITNQSDNGNIAFYGSKKADETSWDDGIPLGMYGYDPYSYYDGIYSTDLNFEMYWDDNDSKRERFIKILDETDYIYITSNRSWGTTVRVPERYPLTTTFYESLIDCPEGKDILWCYSVATPGMFTSNLDFDLVEVFQSEPHIGNIISINTQFAEEAFTVYDHPKVFIFKKNDSYRSENVREILNAVDLTNVPHIIPGDAASYKESLGIQSKLMLPAETWAAQQISGTWSDIFNINALYNQSQVFAVLVWYLSILLLSWIVYPMMHLAFPNFRFNGYPYAKIAGMLLLALGSWWLSSNGMLYTKATIGMVVLLLVIVNGVIFLFRREKIIADVSNNWSQYLKLEIISLGFFLFFLLVRIGNPDLWHPAKGGEKPMDFSYFNAVLKTDTFPAYDPWYAGGYLNYYYYGFVIVGTLVKFLGIVPAVAYNLILPSLYSICAVGAFGIAWNLAASIQKNNQKDSPWFDLAGIFAAMFSMVIGNLGTLRMIWHGFIRIGGGILPLDDTRVIDRISWTFQGISKFFGGESLGYGYGNWYWDPSRAFPAEPITEFPMFTYLYADLHAHLIALPVTIFALAIVMNLILSITHGKFKNSELIAISLLAGVVVGALSPTNTWDMPLYLILFSLAYLYISVVHPYFEHVKHSNKWDWLYSLQVLLAYAVFMASVFLLYEPYRRWYGAGYTSFNEFSGTTTPFWSYITHWGFFLFIYISWLVWESRDWMANTPAKILLKFKNLGVVFLIAGLVWLSAVIWLNAREIHIAWLVLLLLPWAAILLMRGEMPFVKKVVLFLYSTGLFITLFVEMYALEGDLGRMNTVFKFYMQVWTIISICSAVILVWLLPAFRTIWTDWRKDVWYVMFGFLTVSVLMFSLTATSGKIKDRMSDNAPHTLDGLAYMKIAEYYDKDMKMELVQDYDAILWMQQNVQGTPVIVEAHTVEYHWGSRFTINTGLPGVLGWNWHQRQQRTVLANNNVQLREDEINNFYNTEDVEQAISFLNEYNVQYIVYGQLESAYYSAIGLSKFPRYDGLYWEKVYESQDTAIYKVIR